MELWNIMREAANVTFGSALCKLFANMLFFVVRGNQLIFWETHKDILCEDLQIDFSENTPKAIIENEDWTDTLQDRGSLLKRTLAYSNHNSETFNKTND